MVKPVTEVIDEFNEAEDQDLDAELLIMTRQLLASDILILCRNGIPKPHSNLHTLIGASTQFSARRILERCKNALDLTGDNLELINGLAVRLIEVDIKVIQGEIEAKKKFDEARIAQMSRSDFLYISYRAECREFVSGEIEPFSTYLIFALMELTQYCKPYLDSYCIDPDKKDVEKTEKSIFHFQAATDFFIDANSAYIYGMESLDVENNQAKARDALRRDEGRQKGGDKMKNMGKDNTLIWCERFEREIAILADENPEADPEWLEKKVIQNIADGIDFLSQMLIDKDGLTPDEARKEAKKWIREDRYDEVPNWYRLQETMKLRVKYDTAQRWYRKFEKIRKHKISKLFSETA